MDSNYYCKPCPCCACTDTAHVVHLEHTVPALERSFSIKCGKCGMSTPHCETRAEAVAVWNKRETNLTAIPRFVVDENPTIGAVYITLHQYDGDYVELSLTRDVADGLACDIEEAVKNIDNYDPELLVSEQEIERIIDEKRGH